MHIIPTPKRIKVVQDRRCVIPMEIEDSGCFSTAIHAFQTYAGRLYQLKFTENEGAAIRVVKETALASEAYRLVVANEKISLYASGNEGANHGFATLLQLMEWEGTNLILPEMEIEDVPDCTYRGMMVDLARNRHPFDYLLSYVDMCYLYKVRVLHLHFTDDQSYTLPSALYPELSTKERCYTQEQIHELVEYAEARGVEIMPEIDVPGHCRSFAEGYGELFGTKGIICQHEDSMEAMRNLFRELCDMFPNSKYIHIGGDEAYGMEEWTKCEQCRHYAKSVGIDSDMEDKKQLSELMYAHFLTEMADVCIEKGRQPVVWEGFSKSVNDKISRQLWVMSWENYYQLTSDLLEAGFKIINCSWNPNYIVAPGPMWSMEEVYRWSIYHWKAVHPDSPILGEEGYESEKTEQILGGQLLAWGDHIPNGYQTVTEGIREERKCLLERLPMMSENVWNIEKKCSYESCRENSDRVNRIILGMLE